MLLQDRARARRSHLNLIGILCLLILASRTHASEPRLTGIIADPATIQLRGPNARQLILIHGKTADGQTVDLTRRAKIDSANPAIASLTQATVYAQKNGTTVLSVEVAGHKTQIPITVQDAHLPRRFNFENDIIPILSRHGCNSAGCHGKAEGQNGFKLSVFGFDPPADYDALTKESRGRRLFFPAPEHSLLLRKASGGVPHGGGVILKEKSVDFETLREWIASGAPRGDDTDPKVVSIQVQPRERQLRAKANQQLRVMAKWSDGRLTDVTSLSKFQSNNDGLAKVDETGLVTIGDAPGEVAIMASFMGPVSVFRAIIPRDEKIASFPKLPEKNFIDKLVTAKLRKLNVTPSQPCDDATFLRRAYLDVIGTLPTPEEAKKFLDDKDANKRTRLIDDLVQRPEFADFWALKWADLLRVDRQALGHKQAYAYYRWIRESIAQNKSLDQFASEVINAQGPLKESGPEYFYKVVKKPGERASTLSMVFLGVRIACAECHHHPFDRWSQTDYFGMQAFFTQARLQKSPRGEILYDTGNPKTTHPRTKEVIYAHPLGEKMPNEPTPEMKREALAKWMTSPKNEWFARNLANRTWAHLMGRGLIEPVDDVRLTNPPTNPELLDALAKSLIESKFDFRQLIRTITASQTYQLSARPNLTNELDETSYSRAKLKRIGAEVLLDMVCQTTGVPEKYQGVPKGARAIQLWDSQVRHDFLTLFGRPVRVSTCECERVSEPNVRQVLHFLNSTRIQDKLSHEDGIVANLVRKHKTDSPIVDELYLTFYSRRPTKDEMDTALSWLKKHEMRRREAVEDLAWSLLSSIEFLFNH